MDGVYVALWIGSASQLFRWLDGVVSFVQSDHADQPALVSHRQLAWAPSSALLRMWSDLYAHSSHFCLTHIHLGLDLVRREAGVGQREDAVADAL